MGRESRNGAKEGSTSQWPYGHGEGAPEKDPGNGPTLNSEAQNIRARNLLTSNCVMVALQTYTSMLLSGCCHLQGRGTGSFVIVAIHGGEGRSEWE